MLLKKTTVLYIMVMCLCMCFSVPVSAEPTDSYIDCDVAPAYVIAYNATSNLSVSNQTAYCISKASGIDAIRISVCQTLQKYNSSYSKWNDVSGATWNRTVNECSISLSNTKSGLSSGKYRLKSVFTLTNSSGKTETLTVYSEEKTI